MEKKKYGKQHFYLKFRIQGIGTLERWRWYKNEASFVKAVAKEFEKKYPKLKIFVEVLDIRKINH